MPLATVPKAENAKTLNKSQLRHILKVFENVSSFVIEVSWEAQGVANIC